MAHATVAAQSRARYHPATDQLSELAILSHSSPFALLSVLSLCSSLSPSEYRDLARVITSGEAFNYCHSTRGGFRKAVIMPHRE